ncbi:hypothetical protein Tco_0349288 [Tanacetum coccineum]
MWLCFWDNYVLMTAMWILYGLIVLARIEGLSYVNAPFFGRPLGAYDIGVATPRALVYAGLMTSGDARSWKAKRTIKISQSSGPIPLVTDETVIKEWEDRMERAATTASSLEAE